jgi:hypothetical protein
MADGKDGKYLTRILGMKGYEHTGGKLEDKMRRVLGTNALLAAVQDVCADWIKVPGIPAIAKKKMRALLEAWVTAKDFKLNIVDKGQGEGSAVCEVTSFAFDGWSIRGGQSGDRGVNNRGGVGRPADQ